MHRVLIPFVLVALSMAVGCSSRTEPVQPKLSDDQIKNAMKQGAEQRESGDPRGGMGPKGN